MDSDLSARGLSDLSRKPACGTNRTSFKTQGSEPWEEHIVAEDSCIVKSHYALDLSQDSSEFRKNLLHFALSLSCKAFMKRGL
jgi:hypothetical protein